MRGRTGFRSGRRGEVCTPARGGSLLKLGHPSPTPGSPQAARPVPVLSRAGRAAVAQTGEAEGAQAWGAAGPRRHKADRAPLGFTVAAQEPGLIRGTRPSELMAVLGSRLRPARQEGGGSRSRAGPSWACVLSGALHLWSQRRSSGREGGPVPCLPLPAAAGGTSELHGPRRAALGGRVRVRAGGVRLRRAPHPGG